MVARLRVFKFLNLCKRKTSTSSHNDKYKYKNKYKYIKVTKNSGWVDEWVGGWIEVKRFKGLLAAIKI